MKNAFLLFILLFLQSLTPFFTFQSNLIFGGSPSLRISPQPIYVKLQTLQEDSVVFWESIPQSFQNHVATIDVSVLSVLISSNAKSINIYKDNVGNLWLAVNYTFKKGDYISTLTWVSSETVKENLTIPESVPFPQNYPNNITQFLEPGRKLPANDTTIKEIAENYTDPQDMIKTIENILLFVNGTQNYDREKVQLLMTGKLNTTDILDFVNDPQTSLETGYSFCFERALLAATMLRAVGVPTRTFTNADLKTWIQVWLPDIGWVDAEVLCTQPQSLFPRPLSFTIPRMIENSSDAMFPFTWLPKTLMRVANLTFSSFEAFNINEYGTLLSQPVDEDFYATSPDKFSFPIIFKPKMMQAALTRNGSDVIFHLSSEERKTSKTLILGKTNTIEFEGLSLSFRPESQEDLVFLYNFSIQETWMFDATALISLVVAVPAIIIFLIYRKRKKIKPQ